MSHEVVYVPGDPTALGQQRLLGELAPRGVELRGQLRLAHKNATQEPGEDDAKDPDTYGHLGRILNHAHQDGRGRRENSERSCRSKRLRPTPDDEGEQRNLEHERLQLTEPLRHHHGNDHRDRDRQERHTWNKDPQAEGSDRDRHEHKVRRR